MKVGDIRPAELVEENRALWRQDVQRLMKRYSQFVDVDCPACESAERSLAFEKDGFMFNHCDACGTVYISPRPTFDLLMDFYRTSASIRHWNEVMFPQTEASRMEGIFKPRALEVARVSDWFCHSRGGTIVDVGAGFGTFCLAVRELGFFGKIVAVEPSHGLAESCRRRGLEVLECPAEDLVFDGADVVTAFELVEHMFNPGSLFGVCREALKPGGILFLTTPNVRGFDLAYLGPASDDIGGPNHLNYFHPDSIRHLAGSCGFEVLRITTPGKLDAERVREKVLEGKIDLAGTPFLKRVLSDEWDALGRPFQEFLAEHGLSSHMMVVARKK